MTPSLETPQLQYLIRAASCNTCIVSLPPNNSKPVHTKGNKFNESPPRIPAATAPRCDSPKVQVGVAGGEAQHGLEGVGGQAVAAVVGHVGHEDGEGVGEQALEQLATLDRLLEPLRPAGILLVVEILNKTGEISLKI